MDTDTQAQLAEIMNDLGTALKDLDHALGGIEDTTPILAAVSPMAFYLIASLKASTVGNV